MPIEEIAIPTRGKLITTCTWDDVPHLDEAAKARLLESYPAFQKDARSKGVPSLGSGSIYQIPESMIKVAPFPIPAHFKRGYGMDVGWNRTAAIFGAWDAENDVLYLCDLHYGAHAEPTMHADAIKGRGAWLKGRIDPASRSGSQEDGRKLLEIYREKGLHLNEADNAVEAGILLVHDKLSAGRVKVFSTLGQWFEEYRLYRRDEKGKVVKRFDHLMDATRYLILSGTSWLEAPPREGVYQYGPSAAGGSSWLGR